MPTIELDRSKYQGVAEDTTLLSGDVLALVELDGLNHVTDVEAVFEVVSVINNHTNPSTRLIRCGATPLKHNSGTEAVLWTSVHGNWGTVESLPTKPETWRDTPDPAQIIMRWYEGDDMKLVRLPDGWRALA